jgi:hypothetical protein
MEKQKPPEPMIYLAFKVSQAKGLVRGLRYLNDDAPGLCPGASRLAQKITQLLKENGYHVEGGY